MNLYNYQLLICDKSVEDDEIKKIIMDLEKLEKEINEKVDKLPRDYEKHRGEIKQLLYKLKEVYADNIDQQQLKNVLLKVYRSYETEEELNYEEVHQKLRTLTNSCIYIYRTFGGKNVSMNLSDILKFPIHFSLYS